MALNLTVDVFCRLVKQHANVAQLVTLYEHSSPLLLVVFCLILSILSLYSCKKKENMSL